MKTGLYKLAANGFISVALKHELIMHADALLPLKHHSVVKGNYSNFEPKENSTDNIFKAFLLQIRHINRLLSNRQYQWLFGQKWSLLHMPSFEDVLLGDRSQSHPI